MTIKELIEVLELYNKNIEVVVDGYEGGFVDLTRDQIELVELIPNKNTEWYYGPHELAYKESEITKPYLKLGRS